MAAITASKNVLEKYDPSGFKHAHLGANATQFFKGGLVGILGADGLLKKAVATDANLLITGVCEDEILTVNAATRIESRSGIFKFAQTGTTITFAHNGLLCYVADDQTVTLTGTPATEVVAGQIYDVDADGGVWVKIQFPSYVNAEAIASDDAIAFTG